jgi:autotransporter-associated beta strand protein
VASGAAALTKAGPGTLVLSAQNTYSANTSVNAGTLTLTGTGSFAASPVVTVASGATLNVAGVTSGPNFSGGMFALAGGQTLQGNGTVTGPLGVRTGATLAPGTSPGTLTVAGGLTFTGGTFTVDITGPTPGTQHDQVVVTSGAVALGAGVATLNIPGPTGTGYTATSRLAIINNTGTGATTGTFAGQADGSLVVAMSGLGGFNWQIYYNADAGSAANTGFNDVVLVAVPVPEPGLCFGLAAVGLAVWQAAQRRTTKYLESTRVKGLRFNPL